MTNIELQKTTVKDTFIKYDAGIHQSLKYDDIKYDGANPNPTDWDDLTE